MTPEWRSSNRATRYPFAETATMTATDGVVILEGTFVDAAVYPVGGTAGLFLSSLVIDNQAATIHVGNEGREQLCSATFPLADPGEVLALTDAHGRAAGVLVSEPGRLLTLQACGVGTHTFGPAATPFCASVCVPTPEVGVRGILLEDGTVMVGNVWLLGDDGVVLTAGMATLPARPGAPARDVQTIRVDVVGDPLFRRRLCGGSTFTSPAFIRQVRLTGENGESFVLSPDANGRIDLSVTDADAADTVLRITTTQDGITVAAVGAAAGG